MSDENMVYLHNVPVSAVDEILNLREEIELLRERLCELHCAVWECPPEEFEEASHADTVEEAHRVNKSESDCRALLLEACKGAGDLGLYRCGVVDTGWLIRAEKAAGGGEGGRHAT